MPTYLIRHVTTYRYRSAVAFGDHRMMFRPRESHDQRSRAFRLEITPTPLDVRWAEDAAGNLVGTARFGQRARELTFAAAIEVDHIPLQVDELRIADHARRVPFSYGAEEARDLSRFVERQHPDPEHVLDRWARGVLSQTGSGETWSLLCRLTETIRLGFAYLRREESGIQTPLQTLKLSRGSCRDFAVLMAEAARSLGLAARFVSGYLRVPDGEPGLQAAGGSTHAWLQVYLPGAGWIDFDPTSGTVGNRDLIRVAAVRDPAQAAPLTGSFIGFPQDYLDMSVSVAVALSEQAAAAPPRMNSSEAA